MTRHIIINLFRFIILVLLQIFVFNHFQLMGFINPYVYILFILLLPLETPKWLLLVLGFIIGYVIDYFSHSIGINIFSTVLVAYLRPVFIKYVIPKLEPGPDVRISIKQIGFSSFLTYTGLLVFIHHITLFYLEIFRLSYFFITLKHAILSSIVTIILILISQYLFYSRKKL